MGARSHPAALAHGEIIQPLPRIHFVTGTVVMDMKPPMRFSRNMTILRQEDGLTLLNSVRLSEPGLRELDRLGEVRHVIRLAGFHGMDDPFYKERYGATVWSVDAPYVAGFNAKAPPYFTPDVVVSDETELPVPGARLITFKSVSRAEALLFLDRDGGIIVSGDCLQNWAKPDRFFNLPARLVMRLMGFIKPHNIGPGWLKSANPDPEEIKALLDLDFAHVLPAHGTPVIGDAKALYAPRISAL